MLMQKVEVFEQAIDSTSGDDLAKVLWLKSPSSEVRYIVDRAVNLFNPLPSIRNSQNKQNPCTKV